MKRSHSSDLEARKKQKDTSLAEFSPCGPCARRDKMEALARFVFMKAANSKAKEEAPQEVHALLRYRNVLKEFEHHIPSVMPEIHCVLKGLLSGSPKIKKFGDKLAHLILQTQKAKAFENNASLVEAERSYKELVAVTMKYRGGDANDALLLYGRVRAKDDPSYISVLPTSVLANILCRVEMKDSKTCLTTCKSFRSTLLGLLKWKAVERPSSSASIISPSSDRVNTLPNEMLFNIFSHLDTKSLLACQDTCSRWRQIVATEGNKWVNHVEIRGCLKHIDTVWRRILSLVRGTMPLSLSILEEGGYKDKRRWAESSISRSFPHDTLEEFSYECFSHYECHQEVWNTVLQCSRLKVLRFSGGESWGGFRVSDDTKLARCGLKKIALFTGYDTNPLYLDEGMQALISKVTSLTIGFLCADAELRRILTLSSATLEELHICSRPESLEMYDEDDSEMEEYDYEDDEDFWDIVWLPKLVSFRGYMPTTLKLDAPSLKKLDLQVVKSIDVDFIGSCGQSLEVFDCYYEGSIGRKEGFLEDLRNALPCLSKCHTLSLCLDSCFLTTAKDEEEDWQDFENKLGFWSAFLSNTTQLPNLCSLKISDTDRSRYACSLPPDKLLEYFRGRTKEGHPLNKLLLGGFPRYNVQSMIQLRQAAPNLVYKLW